MPRALPLPVREQVVERHQKGETLRHIALTTSVGASGTVGIPYRTVLHCWRRFRLSGTAGLAIHYDQCGPKERRYPQELVETALDLKRDHPSWGGGLIRLELPKKLAEKYPNQPVASLISLPSVRTLQVWFKAAHLQPARATHPPVENKKERGRKAHDVWQVDAKERMHLGDQSCTSTLAVTDEASGGLLGVTPFPPVSLDAGSDNRGPAGSSREVHPVGPARPHTCR
jgi:hypothetical protein